MSWSAWLHDEEGLLVIDENYTHNCNWMIGAALDAAGIEIALLEEGHPLRPCIGPLWYYGLRDVDGFTGRTYLDTIVKQLEADPERYEALNPANGWGSYATLLPVLTSLRDAVPEDRASTWSASG